MTTESEDPSLRFLPRIRQELDKLSLTEEQKDRVADGLLPHVAFIDTEGGHKNGGNLHFDSLFLEFADKMRVVLEHFKSDGLTEGDYLAAVNRRPGILIMNPKTVIANIEGMVKRFEADGLTTRDYLKSIIKQPALIGQTAETLAGNITGVVDRLAHHGLTRPDYLRAALKHPQLFQQSPETIAGYFEDVVARFARDGLEAPDYLKAMLKQPSLFPFPPDAVISNVTEVVQRYEQDGLTTRDYINAALRQPSLFASSPETITRHIDAVLGFADRGIFVPPATGRKDRQDTNNVRKPARVAAIEFLMRNPAIISLADDNFGVREVHHHLTNGPTDYRLLNTPRHHVERELMEHLGHNDPQQPVPNDGFVAGTASPTKEQAERFVLRALMHAGLIKGSRMER